MKGTTEAALALGIGWVGACGGGDGTSAVPVREPRQPESEARAVLHVLPAVELDPSGDFFWPEPPVVEALPAGVWEGVGCPEWAWLQVRPAGQPGEYRVRHSRLRGAGPTPVHEFGRATGTAEQIVFDPPLFGSASWRLHGSEGEQWLAPSTTRSKSDEAPEGMRFRLVDRATTVRAQWPDPDRFLPEY